jgi:hypothetical protein
MSAFLEPFNMHLTMSPYFWLPNQDSEYIQITWEIAAMLLGQIKLSRIIMQLRRTNERIH